MYGSDAGTAASPTASARLELRSSIASLELTVLDSQERPIARGLGRLEVAVEPGIYEVELRAGPIIQRRLVRVARGELRRLLDLELEFPAAAPVSGTSTSREPHQRLVQAASQSLRGSPTRSGLVVMVRDASASGVRPLTPVELGQVAILDAWLRPLPNFGQGWWLDEANAAAAWAGVLPPGGYVRRVGGRTEALEHSVWLSAGWQTLVFIGRAHGAIRTEGASVHITGLEQEWMPEERDVGQALELALWGLRTGRPAVPDDLLRLLLEAKYVNPMLGIIGAHALALRAERDLDTLDTVVANLERLVPGHPDVVGLRYVAAERRATALSAPPAYPGAPIPALPPLPPPAAPITWPPVLIDSYRALIRADGFYPGLIAPGSVADHAAAQLVVQDALTAWRPLDPARLWAASENVRAGVPPASAIAMLARRPQPVERLVTDDPAARRVARYLDAVTAVEGAHGARDRLLSLSPAEIGLATTLPVAAVDRALSRIGGALAPVGGGGLPWLKTLLALILVPAMLLGAYAVAQALGWLDGPVPAATDEPPSVTDEPPLVTDEPPLVTDAPPSPPPTDEPTLQPTAEPTSPPTPEPTPEIVTEGFLRPDPLEFGEAIIGETRPRELIVANAGPGELTVLGARAEDGEEGEWEVDLGSCDRTLSANETCGVIVFFTPALPGDRKAAILIETQGAGLLNSTGTGQGVFEGPD